MPYVHRPVNQLRGTESDETSAKLFSYFGEDRLKRLGSAFSALGVCSSGDLPMPMIKVIALVLGAGMLVSLFAGEFGPDLLLAIVTCLS